jgi:hypothetical protein
MKYTQQLSRLSRLPQVAFALFLGCLLTLSTGLSLANDADLTGSSRGISLEIFSQLSPIEINTIHSWEVVLTDEDGAVSGATLDIVGGMPEHNHGMPTQPQITEELAPGRYLLEGVRFHMPGPWRLTASISTEKTRGRPPTVIVIDFTL